MSDQAKGLAASLKAFNAEVMGFVERCSEEDWAKMCVPEEWSVGVTARHIGAGHFGIVDWVEKMVAGEKLPDMTEQDIVNYANAHAREHAGCTKGEVLEILRAGGAAMTDYVAGLDDAALAKTSYFSMMKQDVPAGKFIELVILMSGGEHFASMKKAVSS